MKTLIAYYSRSGHTRKAAEIMSKILDAEIDEIIDKKLRSGIFGFLSAGYDATFGKKTDIKFKKDPKKYDVVIIGTPVWNGRLTPVVRTYLIMEPKENKRERLFCYM